MPGTQKKTIKTQRLAIGRRLERWLEAPMFVLGVLWLALLVVELTRGLSSALELIGTLIWAVFAIEFLLRVVVAPHKPKFLRNNIVTIVALLIPALRVFRFSRVFRVLRVGRAVRGVRLVRLVTSFNRGMRALGATLGRRGFGYVALLTMLVTVLGAAGMYAFEREGLDTYGSALWWAAMLMTTMGSEYWPRTGEGRILCFLLSLYAFGVFGYFTATIATFFIGRDAESEQGEVAGAQQVDALAREIRSLRLELRRLSDAETLSRARSSQNR
jgi:voltage-gated potassium channel